MNIVQRRMTKPIPVASFDDEVLQTFLFLLSSKRRLFKVIFLRNFI